MRPPKRVKSLPREEAQSLPAAYTAYAQLRDMIYSGKLESGIRLVERELSDRLAISRIPLREALIRLQTEGLVRSVRNTASYVVDFSPRDLLEIYSIRRLIEPYAAKIAAGQITQDTLRELRALCQEMTELSSRPANWSELDECDYEFHRTIVQASRHTRLIRAYDISQIRILGSKDEYRYLQTAAPDAMALEHLAIVDILEKGDAKKAEAATFNHVDESMQGFMKSYKFKSNF